MRVCLPCKWRKQICLVLVVRHMPEPQYRKYSQQETERFDTVAGTPASYLEGPAFKSRPADRVLTDVTWFVSLLLSGQCHQIE